MIFLGNFENKNCLHACSRRSMVQGGHRYHQGSEGQGLQGSQRLRLPPDYERFAQHGRRLRDQGHQRHGHGRVQVQAKSEQ